MSRNIWLTVSLHVNLNKKKKLKLVLKEENYDDCYNQLCPLIKTKILKPSIGQNAELPEITSIMYTPESELEGSGTELCDGDDLEGLLEELNGGKSIRVIVLTSEDFDEWNQDVLLQSLVPAGSAGHSIRSHANSKVHYYLNNQLASATDPESRPESQIDASDVSYTRDSSPSSKPPDRKRQQSEPGPRRKTSEHPLEKLVAHTPPISMGDHDNGHASKILTFHLVTYNVAEKDKPTGDLTPILGLENKPDLISIGLEESGDFDVLPDGEGEKQDPWCEGFNDLLRAHGYYLVDLTSVWQIKLRVYLLKKHMNAITNVEAVTAQSGFVGGVQNIFKGATTVRFRLYGKHVAILNCHLTAFDNRSLDRNTEFWQFFADQEFADPEASELYEHDYIFWTGDLNYRIEHENAKVREMVAKGEHLQFLQYDQLRKQQEEGLAFVGFREADITFKPSYKFDIGTDTYDTSKKQRIPSYCDRILWRSKVESTIEANQINWAPSFSIESDTDSESVSSKLSALPEMKSRLFKKKVMRKKDNTLRKEQMRRKTLGVLRKMSITAASGLLVSQITDSADKIELTEDHITDKGKYKELVAKVQERSQKQLLLQPEHSSVQCLSYTSYHDIRLSDHKPVSATLQVAFSDADSAAPIVLKAKTEQWSRGKALKLNISSDPMRNKVSSSDWVGLFAEDWVNKRKYITYSWVQKKRKPDGLFTYKVKFGAGDHPKPKQSRNLQAVYFKSSGYQAPVTFAEIVAV